MAKEGILGTDQTTSLVSSPEMAAIPMPASYRGAIVAAAATAATASLVLIGWYLDLEVLKRIVPGLVAMNPLTAVTFLIAAFCLGNLAVQKNGRRPSASLWIGRVCALLVGLVGAVQLTGLITGHHLHLDQLLFPTKLAAESVMPNTMAPNTAFNFLLIGIALWLLQARNRRVSGWACIFALISGFESLLAILGYTYRVRALYGIESFIPMALHTAICFAVLIFGVMSYQANRGFLAIILGNTAGGRMARHLLPAAILVPAVLGWLRLEGQRIGLYNAEFGVALYTVTNMLLFAGIVSCNAYSLFRSDTRRSAAESRLRRTHDALALAERRLHAIVDNATSVIYVKDPEGRFLLVNDCFAKLLNRSKAEIIGRTGHDLYPAASADIFRANDLAALKAGVPLESEETVEGPEGARTFISSKFPLREISGEIYALCCVSTEITERKKASEAIETLQRRFETILDSVGEGIHGIDLDGRITFENPAATRMLGWNASELAGNHAHTIMHHTKASGEPYPVGECPIYTTLRDGETRRVEDEVFWRKDGSSFPVEYTTTPVRDECGAISGAVVAFRDVTESAGIREIQAKFAAIIESSDDAIISKTLDGVITSWNPAAEKIFGYSAQEAIGQPMTMLIPPERRAEETQILAQIGRGESIKHFETVWMRKDGELLDVSATISPLKDRTGKIIGASKITRDITDQKRTQSALFESRREVEAAVHVNQLIMENSRDVICTIDEDGRFGVVSAACETLWGYKPVELIGKPYIDMVHPDDREKTGRVAAKIMVEATGVSDFENRYIRKDGSVLEVLWSAYWSEADRTMFAVAHDISARKEAEKILQESEAQLAASAERTQRIVAAAHDAFVGMDAAGVITDWNPQAEATFGWSAAEAIGQPMHDLIVPPKFRESHVQGIKHFLATGEGPVLNKRIELPALHRDGRELPVELTISPIPVGDTFMFSAFLRDVSNRKRAEEKINAAKEEAELANRAKSEFLSRMSHELRTPMNAILGFAQLLALEDLETDQREALGHIMKGGEHLLKLINEVLDISRIEAGRLSLSCEPVEIAEAMREIIDLMQPLATAAEVRLNLTHPGSTYVLADRQRLQQVLINLVSNAIKYNRTGGSVSLTCELSSDRVRILVKDTGIGIPEKHLEQLFSPFERLGAEQGEIEGTGLGLTVTKRLVEVMNGTIGVESNAGGGSTFWIELARTESPLAHAEAGQPPSPIDSMIWGESGTVLYVEDNFSNLKLIESLFRLRPALKLIAARDGKSGLQMAREQQPALILLDLNLPDMNGRDVLTKLRTEPLTSTIPVIALSADATPGQIEKLMRAGAADYLTKPINIQKFLEVLDRILNATTQPARHAEVRELTPAFETQPQP